jgi:hypothetical protein
VSQNRSRSVHRRSKTILEGVLRPQQHYPYLQRRQHDSDRQHSNGHRGRDDGRQEDDQRDLFRDGLDEYQIGRLSELLRFLNKQRKCNKRRYRSITEDLKAYLECTRMSSTHDDWPPKHSMNVMASSLVDVMDTGKYFQLVRPVSGSLHTGRGAPYRAILVRDRDDLHSVGATYVFTSWSGTNKHNKGIMETRKIAKYVSTTVSVDEGVKKWTYYAEEQ